MEVWREVDGGRRRDVNVGDFDVGVGDFGGDEEHFGSPVVDARLKLVELDGVVDEGEKATAATTGTIEPDNGEIGKRRSFRGWRQL